MFRQAHLRVYGAIWLVAIAGFCWLLLQPKAPVNTCIFKQATGLPCPACGSTRSVQAMLHGHWPQVFSHNPLGIVTFIMVVAGVIWSAADVFRGSQSLYLKTRQWQATIRRPIVAWPLVILLLANWVWSIFKHL
ncbi:MAG: DUF2752 domain-containing protein [Chitinophagaceae bacterium]|jgi:hypothetical protein|nr:DUF2752 domain-containing protein [Chitinophagaceae bacterium]